MLVLTRKRHEAIVFDGHIRITVLDIRKGQVKLGIDAPKEVPVNRQDVAAPGAQKGSEFTTERTDRSTDRRR
jgi:carbon storage regulator